MKILRFATWIIFFSIASERCLADEGEKQAESFANLYSKLCMSNLSSLDVLRERLKPIQAFPPEKAEPFLAGHPGDAWPIPNEHGLFVLALPKEMKLCIIHGRRTNTESAKKLFLALVETAPTPFVVRKVSDLKLNTAQNGETHTISYEWSLPNVPKSMLFTLSTAPSKTAQLQVMGSAAIVVP